MTTIQRDHYGERGESKIGVIIGFIVFLFIVFVVIKTVPIFLAVGAFDDEIINIAEGRGYKASSTKSVDKKNIAKAVVQRAAKVNRLLDKENQVTEDKVEVEYHGNVVKIMVSYVLEIDYVVFTYEWKKEHVVERPRFGRI
jgi:hypothetical protein